jgi:hypothetical protein
VSHLKYWHPSEHTLKYRVKWWAGKTYHKDFPPTDEGLVKLAKFIKEKQLPSFGTGIYVQKLLPSTNRKEWIRLPYALPITAVLGYLKDKGLLNESK